MNKERQGHGFAFEEKVISHFKMTPSDSYTSEWDAYFNGHPVSIKVAKFGSDIEMADYFRNSNKTEDFYLVVGFWEGEKTNIISSHMLFIPHQDWINLFAKGFDVQLRELLNEITNSYEDDDEWQRRISNLKKQWKRETPNLIRPRFKRDHGSQKRIQCAINNKDFYNHFVKRYEVDL